MKNFAQTILLLLAFTSSTVFAGDFPFDDMVEEYEDTGSCSAWGGVYHDLSSSLTVYYDASNYTINGFPIDEIMECGENASFGFVMGFTITINNVQYAAYLFDNYGQPLEFIWAVM